MSLVAVAIGVGVAGTAASAYLSNSAQQKGIKAQEAGLAGEQGVDIPAISTLASQSDLTKYQQQFTAEASVDPQFAALRNQGAQGVLGVLADQANPNSIGNKAISSAASTVNQNTPLDQGAISDLISKARDELNAGATLPASFQAELVRSGLAAGGAAGTGVSGEGATGVGARTLLGSAGIQLQQERAAQAEGELGSAQTLQAQQEAALNELTQLSMNLNQSKAAIGAGAAGMGTAALPSIGLSGSQVAGLSVGNTNLSNQKSVGQGNLGAQSAADTGAMYSNIIGGLTGAIGGALGSVGSSGWLSNLFQGSSITPTSSGGALPGNVNYGNQGVVSGLNLTPGITNSVGP